MLHELPRALALVRDHVRKDRQRRIQRLACGLVTACQTFVLFCQSDAHPQIGVASSTHGPDLADLYRRTAGYVDRILKGEKPADLPVQAPTKYALAINLKTAKALGIQMPATLLGRADEGDRIRRPPTQGGPIFLHEAGGRTASGRIVWGRERSALRDPLNRPRRYAEHPLDDHAAFELGKHAHHLKHGLAGGCRGVDALLMQGKVNPECVQLGKETD